MGRVTDAVENTILGALVRGDIVDSRVFNATRNGILRADPLRPVEEVAS